MFGLGPLQIVTIGRRWAEAIDDEFVDGHNLPSVEIIRNTRANVPLMDEDRRPWLGALLGGVKEHRLDRKGCVFTGSAKRSYQDRLSGHDLQFTELQESPAVIRQGRKQRRGHFMPAALIEDLFSVLQTPTGLETVVASLPAQTPRERCCTILDQSAAAYLRTHDAHET